MRRAINGIVGILALLLIMSCSSDDQSSGPSLLDLETYLTNLRVTPNFTNSGLGYIVEDAGDNMMPSSSSTVKIVATGMLTNNQQVLTTTGSYINLCNTQIIEGLREGLELIGEGGRIRLFIPSELGFGELGADGIPPGADLIFDVELESLLRTSDEYILENNISIDTTSASGAKLETLTEGNGENPTMTSFVAVHYTGYFSNGEVFDESPVDPLQLSLNNVIVGWQELIPLMKEGGTARFYIPSPAAYGTSGFATIPGKTDLIFEIELVEVL